MAKQKNPRKRRVKKTSKKYLNSNTKIIISLVTFIMVLIGIICFLIYLLNTNISNKKISAVTKIERGIKQVKKKAQDDLSEYFDEYKPKQEPYEEDTEELYKDYVHKEIKQKQVKKPVEKKLVKTKKEVTSNTSFHKVLQVETSKPKLAIIVDDVTTQYQINHIKNLGFKTSVSLMPPTKKHPNSAKIAKGLPFYLIHFPLEAQFFHHEETNTLHVGDSYEKIEKRVAQVRKWYPKAKFVNNHTGSKFTSSEKAMDKLFKALVKYNFVFVDSRTTAKSVAKQMAKKYHMPYIVRNVFLDNKQEFDYIQNQLKQAIRIAKKRGYAIAICHPHSMSLKVLRESKHLLKGLELVYLNQIPSTR